MPESAGGRATANDAAAATASGNPDFDKTQQRVDREQRRAAVRNLTDKLKTEKAAVKATEAALRAAKADLKENG